MMNLQASRLITTPVMSILVRRRISGSIAQVGTLLLTPGPYDRPTYLARVGNREFHGTLSRASTYLRTPNRVYIAQGDYGNVRV
jgi:hypothetical protein